MSRNFNLELGFHEALKKALADLHAAKLEQLGLGTAKTFEAYRESVGYLRALGEVADEAEKLRKQLTEM